MSESEGCVVVIFVSVLMAGVTFGAYDFGYRTGVDRVCIEKSLAHYDSKTAKYVSDDPVCGE